MLQARATPPRGGVNPQDQEGEEEGCRVGVGDQFSVTDVTGDGFSLARARTNDQEIARVSPNEQFLGRQPSGAAGQHEVAQDRRSANRQRAGDAYLRHVLIGGRNDADQIEGLRSLAELQRQHYARR